MIKDATNGIVDADICIVGAGAAGLALAAEFLDSSTRIVVLESGAESSAPDSDPLYEFESSAFPVTHESRRRAYGGTTTTWAGRWKRLDPIDFEKRPWVPSSGWPISYESLLPYYVRASALLGIGPYTADPRSTLIPHSDLLEPIAFEFQAGDKRHWGKLFRDRLYASRPIEVYTQAHVLSLKHTGNRVTEVEAKTDTGTLTVKAKQFVLALGGIETPRLMLISRIGNNQVGRYYMDHPKGAFGTIEGIGTLDLSESALYEGNGASRIGFRLTEDTQRKMETLNSHIALEPVAEASKVARAFAKLAPGRTSAVARVYNYLEQAPIESNRVTLSDTKDAFGNARAVVHWTVGADTEFSALALHRALAEEVERLGIGRFRASATKSLRDASHHMGTTRMGTNPRDSVVDSECKVHGIDNLYVAGPSVFPTGGSAGPTATIAALSIRLADHLKSQI